MTDPVPRAVVEAFYKAYAVRDIEKDRAFLDDDVTWTISGPVDVLPFCGTRHGKAAVLDLIERGRCRPCFRVFSFVPDAMLVDGDRAAMLSRQSARRKRDGRVISYRLAQFHALPRRQGGRKSLADRQLRRGRAGARSCARRAMAATRRSKAIWSPSEPRPLTPK